MVRGGSGSGGGAVAAVRGRLGGGLLRRAARHGAELVTDASFGNRLVNRLDSRFGNRFGNQYSYYSSVCASCQCQLLERRRRRQRQWKQQQHQTIQQQWQKQRETLIRSQQYRQYSRLTALDVKERFSPAATQSTTSTSPLESQRRSAIHPRPKYRSSSASYNGSSKRFVTYVAPVTSANAARNVPEKNRELHAALSTLESQAAEYVNLSLLALALRGLEARDPITRIAIQSSAPRSDARKLARLLVADPHEPEQEWETLIQEDNEDERAVLLRYSRNADVDTTNPLVRVLNIPSSALEKHRLELLLVQRDNGDSSSPGIPQSEEDSLVQTIETPISATGRHSQVAYPVHRAILQGKGVDALLSIGKDETENESPWSALRQAAIDVNQQNPDQPSIHQGINLISIKQAERALAVRRQAHPGTSYTEDWARSGLTTIYQFTFNGILPSTTLKPLHRAFISNLLLNATVRLAQEQTAVDLLLPVSKDVAATIDSLRDAITLWSESAHTELRDELANAFAGRSWRRLAWWKLPFRVDDVGMIASDILTRFYLADAEKGIIWLGGRLEQAGITDRTRQVHQLIQQFDANMAAVRRGEKIMHYTEPDRDKPESYFQPASPWPQSIALSRFRLLTSTLPALQARAQSLLLSALSGTSISTAIGALAYAMVSTTSLYEAGAVAALGTVVSLGRLQRHWDRARDAFEADVQHEGRLTLERVEREARELMDNGNTDNDGPGNAGEAVELGRSAAAQKSNVDQVTLEDQQQQQRDIARDAIAEAREALHRLQ